MNRSQTGLENFVFFVLYTLSAGYWSDRFQLDRSFTLSTGYRPDRFQTLPDSDS